MAQSATRRVTIVASDEAVLRLLLDGRSRTRAQICAETGLSRPTVTDTLARFAAGKLIVADTRPLGRAGRHPEVIAIDPKRFVVFAADVGGTKVIAALVDVAGRILVERTVHTASHAAALAAQLKDLRRDLAVEAAVDARSVVAAVVGLPGVAQPDGRIAHGANVHGLDEVDVPALFADSLECPVMIENDVNLAGVGELERSPSDVHGPFVLVSVGTGIGMAIISNGRVVKGATGRAGEIGYMPLFGDAGDPAMRKFGSAELTTSGTALERRYAARGGSGSAERVIAMSDSGDATARAVVSEFADDLARVLVSIAAILDPVRIVLGGGLGSNPSLLAPVNEAVARIAPFPVEVVVSDLGARSAICGAAALGGQCVREYLLERFAGVTTGEPPHNHVTDNSGARVAKRR